MTLQWGTVESLTRMNGVKLCIYGKPKTGKTMLCGTAPNPVIISAERGLLSLRKDPATRNLPAVEIHTLAQFDEAHRWSIESAEAKQFDTICLDSISELAEVCLIEEKIKTLQSTPKGKKPNGFEPYMELSQHIMSVFRSYRDHAHKNVLFIAKEEWDKDEVSGSSQFRPTMPGRELTKQLPYMLDEILQLVRFADPNGAPYNYLRTTADNQNVAGDRSGKLDAWEQPNITAIINKILG